MYIQVRALFLMFLVNVLDCRDEQWLFSWFMGTLCAERVVMTLQEQGEMSFDKNICNFMEMTIRRDGDRRAALNSVCPTLRQPYKRRA